MHRILGTGVILLNIMIFSPLFDLVAHTQSTTIIKVLAILAASFAGLQTLFKFERDAETHLSAGDAYSQICRKTQLLLAEYKDRTKDPHEVVSEFRGITLEYLQANKDSKGCIPSEREYAKARRVLKRLDQKRRTEGEPSSQLPASQTESPSLPNSGRQVADSEPD